MIALLLLVVLAALVLALNERGASAWSTGDLPQRVVCVDCHHEISAGRSPATLDRCGCLSRQAAA